MAELPWYQAEIEISAGNLGDEWDEVILDTEAERIADGMEFRVRGNQGFGWQVQPHNLTQALGIERALGEQGQFIEEGNGCRIRIEEP